MDRRFVHENWKEKKDGGGKAKADRQSLGSNRNRGCWDLSIQKR